MLKKGPEIKLSEFRIPDFMQDVYYDLRERHLLPLVALLAVAIIAVPVALADSGTPEEAIPPTAVASQAENANEIVVAKSAPGLRDYHQRLKHLTAKNPFTPLESPSKGSESSNEGSSSVPSEGGESVSSPEETTSSPESPGTGTETGKLKFFSYAIDVRVVPVSSNGKPSKAEPSTRSNLPELTQLPSRNTPAIVFMGVTHDAKKAVMMVSSDVSAIFGDGTCVVGSETCELLAMEPGVPETFVFGANKRVFRIEVLKLQLLATDKLNRAPLGKPNKQQKKH